jgi:pimeloyl-ACP methyl ester carboxylesterase
MPTDIKTQINLLIASILVSGCASVATSPPIATLSPLKPLPTVANTATELSPTPAEPTATQKPTPIPATATPDVPFETVTFTTEDGVEIAATLFGEGDLTVLLLHMGKGIATGNDQEDWHPFARYLAEHGYSALTLDFRGRGGSGGDFGNDLVMLDAQAGLDFLRQRGFSRFVCIGAGVGGTTCMFIAKNEDLLGLVVLSSSLSSGPTNQVSEADLAQLTIPKLYLYGERDSFGFPEAMQKIYRLSAEPKALTTCDTAAHGTDLLYGPCSEDIHLQLLYFLESIDQ